MGRGGKGLLHKQAFECGLDGRLIAFDREQIIPALLIEYLACRFILRVKRVGQHDLAQQILLLQQVAPGRDFVALGLGDHTAQKASLGVDRIDDLHPTVTNLFTVDDHDPILRRSQNLILPPQDRKSTRLNSSHLRLSRMPSSA